MTTLIIRYYGLGDNRFLRSLNFEEYPDEFIKHNLNLYFIEVKNKSGLEKDFKMCCEIITREGKQLKAVYTNPI